MVVFETKGGVYKTQYGNTELFAFVASVSTKKENFEVEMRFPTETDAKEMHDCINNDHLLDIY